MSMSDRTILAAQVGYGMFGGDVVAGTTWDLQRNSISPYLARIGLDDFCEKYHGTSFKLVAIGTHTKKSALRAQKINERETGYKPEIYYGDEPWVDIIKDFPDLDLLLVATPDHLHTPPILEALENGINVVTEKPMCLDIREADRIIELAESKGLIVGVDMHKRFDPDHLEIFNNLSKRLGDPIYGRGVLEEPLEVSTKTFKWAEKSDPNSYVGIHWIDLFMYYLNLKPVALYAVAQKKRLKEDFNKNAFDAVQVLVTYQNGMTVLFETNWITPKDFEGPVNQESQLLCKLGKVESDSQYRGLRFWIEGEGSRTANTHFFRKVRRPDGSYVSVGYGKDSLICCIEKVYRMKFLNATAKELEGTYPDAKSQRLTVAVVHAAREVILRNYELFSKGLSPVVTASFSDKGIILHDPYAKKDIVLYDKPI